MLLFAFSGKMRSGKDTAADYIERKLIACGLGVKRMAFADTLKRIRAYAQKEAGFPIEKDRMFEQWIGTDWGRAKDPDVWVKALERQILAVADAGEADAILVTDLRFPNELEMARRLGFTVVRTHAAPSTRIARGAEVDKLEHLSETALDFFDRNGGMSWDWFIENEGTLETFQRRLDVVFRKALYFDQENF